MSISLHRPEMDTQYLELERDLFFTCSFDLMGIVGVDGYFKRVNPAFEHVLGFSAAELYAQPLSAFLHPDDVTKTMSGIQSLAAGRARIGSVNRYRGKDGRYRWFSWNTRPLGPLLYSVGREITEQVISEERNERRSAELLRKNEELEHKIEERLAELRRSEGQLLQLQKMDAIGRLAGGIAHDFNNMLNAITLCCDQLAEGAESPPVVRENLEDIRNVTARAAALTRQLLIFSRKQVGQPEAVALNPLLRQLEKMLARLIGENIRIDLKLDAQLSPTHADPSQLEQIVLNLVVNAKDAMPRGGTITLETSNVYLGETLAGAQLPARPGHYVLLSVSDEGEGMDRATLDRIFEPFFTTKPAGKGTGLGLTTTYGIVKQCEGSIWLSSAPGKGTVVKIFLPVTAERLAEPPLPSETCALGAQNQCILLVEDEGSLRAGIAGRLARMGYRVIEAASGAEALEICARRTEPVDLLLTDVSMPGMTGFELAKVLLAETPQLRILFMSGYASDALAASGIENVAALNFLPKPFDTSGLLRKVHEVLGKG